jgi:3'-phosphoadenosine 5'-phosphosulfate sulfotransferase (PAPS reductase)/FAD synthetase
VQEALYSKDTVSVASENTVLLVQTISGCPGVTGIERDADLVRFSLTENWSVADVNKYLVEHHVPVNYLQQKKSSLEQKFLEILKENDRVSSPAQSIPS